MKERSYSKFKFMISLLLVLSLLVTTSTSVFAIKIPEGNHYIKDLSIAGIFIESEVAAQLLSQIGFFENSTGSIFSLDEVSTKLEGLIMYIRLLGKEKEALKMADQPCAFKGVPDKAKGYVNYAYKHKDEILSGLGDNIFSPTEALDENTFFILLLRALGYDDRKGDFSLDNPRDKAFEAGIVWESTYNGMGDRLKKHSMVVVCYFTLLAKTKGTEKTLAEQLISKGVIDKFKAVHAGVFMGDEETGEFGLNIERSPYVKSTPLAGDCIDSEIAAVLLSQLGLFEKCSSIFELDTVPTKLEGLIMYIKLLGKEKEALIMTDEPCAFKHVPYEAKGYVNYAYKHKDEILYDLREDIFNLSQPLDKDTFFVLMLRALGYDDRKGDFSYEDAWSNALTVGITTDAMYGSFVDGFEKDSMASSCYFTLMSTVKGTEMTLAEKLISQVAIDDFTAVEIGLSKNVVTKDLWGMEIQAEYTNYVGTTPMCGNTIDSEMAALLLSRIGFFEYQGSKYGLENFPKKLDGLVMYIKLLGKEKEALKMAGEPCAFKDVPDEAKGYVNYANKYKKELLYGLGEDMFSSTKLLDENTFFVLLLRALGYDDRKGDFSIDNPFSKAYEILLTDSTYSAFVDGFEKDSMAVVCYFALLTEMKGTDRSLAEELVSKGVVDRNTAAGIGVVEYQE